MCGICGVVALGKPPETDLVKRMTSALAHRGPDGEGFYKARGIALGFRRLAIIDLSEAGMQPFASEDGRFRLLHNGEVYNYRELRRELEAKGHSFRSATDTEVILAAYREWGEACVERFNGMWAFAVWDDREQRLFCSRDRFGVKPFYYRYDGGRFVFASEPKAFRADRGTPLEPNLAAVREYLSQAFLDHTRETFFRGIHRLEPAHSLTLDSRGLRVRRYWQLETRDPPGDAAKAFRDLFLDSIRLRLRSDVPVGTCLSGGLDSSSIVGAVSYLLREERENALAVGEQQRAFTAFFEDRGLDERPFARAVIEASGAQPHWISFDAERLVTDLPRIVEAQDEPFGSTSMAAQWYVMRAAHEAGLTVMLDGQGGDEILGGYRAQVGERLSDLLVGGRLTRLSTELAAFRPALGTRSLVSALGRPFAPERVQRFVRARARGSAALVHRDLPAGLNGDGPESPNFPDRLRRYSQRLLTRRGLPELLRYEDRNSMAHSLEARVPFLDYRLVELCFSLPGDELIRNGRTKDLLRRSLADLLPEPVRERRDKLGFMTPEGRWLRGALGDLAADVFASRRFVQRGFVDAKAAQRRLEQHRGGELDAGFELWRALNLELWARALLDGSAA
jgi:asparagine synthase (glutamine-hydrolysing)